MRHETGKKKPLLCGLAAAALLTAAWGAAIADVPGEGVSTETGGLGLLAIDHPQRDTIATIFERTAAAPDAKVISGTNYRDGKAKIAVAYNGMRPAALFGGDVTAYVVWAIEPDGHVENLGELTIRSDDDGRQDFSTGLKEFALLITAEPHYLVQKPSSLVIFKSTVSNDKDATVDPFTFDGFAPSPVTDVASIKGVKRDLGTSVDLIQARKAFELAERAGAYATRSDDKEQASLYLERAEQMAREGNTGRLFRDACRSSVTHSHQAMIQQREGAETAARQAERDRLADAAAIAAASAAHAAEKAAEAAESKARAREAEALLAQERAERERLEIRLHEALSQFMESRRTERGLVVNLPDVLFELDKAELTPHAREQLAKAAVLLREETQATLSIEGHTDSTGTSEYNLKLSQARAQSVADFMAAHGVPPQRINAVGFGEFRPVADNDTEASRQRNRRVEIVVAPSST